jgi:hypothetical protein
MLWIGSGGKTRICRNFDPAKPNQGSLPPSDFVSELETFCASASGADRAHPQD